MAAVQPYAYVSDDPINGADPAGRCWPWCTAAIGAGLGALAGGASYLVSTEVLHTGSFSWGGLAGSAAEGAVVGAVAGLAGPAGGTLAAALGYETTGIAATALTAGINGAAGARSSTTRYREP